MLLRNVHTMGSDIQKDIRILNGKIQRITEYDFKDTNEPSINLDGALIFPGLINSHDHLDFNCFPALGHRVYSNYREWGNDIQRRDKLVIEQVLNIPENLRTRWGIYKNLLNGVTTVVNHGKHLEVDEDLIQIFQEAHSIIPLASKKTGNGRSTVRKKQNGHLFCIMARDRRYRIGRDR
jgi:cytosine/adenosine deaminase-related metal-dependent hydrolase